MTHSQLSYVLSIHQGQSKILVVVFVQPFRNQVVQKFYHFTTPNHHRSLRNTLLFKTSVKAKLPEFNLEIMKLTAAFYTRSDVVQIAKDLLGKFLVTNINGQITSGMIVETEAYCGRNDEACHANNGRRTKRTEIMFQEGGKAYVYLCYGIHHLFNVTTNINGLADAVLVRGLEPIDGLDHMMKRRNMKTPKSNLSAGPGSLSKALGITTTLYGQDLAGNVIWIENRGINLYPKDIEAGKRVGVDYAHEDALKPWRFVVKNSIWMSKPRIL